MPTVQTLFGTFDDKQLKELKGAISEINEHMFNIKQKQNLIKEIVDVTYDNLKIPKKIIKRMAKVYYNQSLQEEVAEFKEFEALFEGITEVK
jgi:phenylpyruvate tautomerase PptA (4-oxalocrotonate tautomerase family)